MKTSQQTKRSVAMIPALWLALLFGFVNSGYAWDYGNGRHGTYVLTTNTTIEQLYLTVRLTNDPAQYNSSDTNAIPNFQNFIITNGATLAANPWNGSTGGRIILKVQATLSVALGSSISVSGIGYRGGGSAQQGESYAGNPNNSPTENYGGGGAGGYINGNNLAGGGGGYGSVGGHGDAAVVIEYDEYSYNFANCGGFGGSVYGVEDLATLYLGSGGGGGFSSATGGNGGGAIAIYAHYLAVNGQIMANGKSSWPVSGNSLGSGGGGSGGSILLRVALATLGNNNISATGGSGVNYGTGLNYFAEYSGSGGDGRVRLEYSKSYTGTTTPTASIYQNISSDNATIITNQPSAQIGFLASNVVFIVGANGYSPLSYQWNFNGLPIPNATNQTFSLFNLDFTNQGNFSVAISNVVGTVVSSNAYLTVLDPRNPFGDGIPNYWKIQYGLSLTDPTLATNYPPGDKLTYLEKYLYGLNPLTNDTDGDGISDYDEIFVYGSNPTNAFTAGDGIADGWKKTNSLNPSIAYAGNVAGFDGVTYLQVYQYDLAHTNQLNPNTPFAAGSGLSNYELINNGQHTNTFYYDHEDRLLGMESSRGISIGYQYDGNGNLLQQNVMSRASETNGLPVLWLWLNGLTNQPGIAYANSSGNGWDNYQEWLAGLSPASNSVPSLLNNPGTNIASIAFPFTPSNCVMAAGQLNGVLGDEIVVGADGNATGKTNSLFILTQGASSWQAQQLPVGSFGITSISIGQPTNRPSTNIYIGLRQTGGQGQIWELFQNGGTWQTNLIAVSTNETAFVYGVRQNGDLLASFATNGLDGALFSLIVANTNGVWSAQVISTASSHRGLGTHALVPSRVVRDASARLIDNGGIEIIEGTNELFSGVSDIPTNAAFNPATGKWYLQTQQPLSWNAAQSYFGALGGNLVSIGDINENNWISDQYFSAGNIWIGDYVVNYNQGASCATFAWIGTASSFFDYYAPCIPAPTNDAIVMPVNNAVGMWTADDRSHSYYAVGEFDSVSIFTNSWFLTEPPATNYFNARGIPFAADTVRPNQTNSVSLLYEFVDDKDSSGMVDDGDDFVFAEYQISGNTWMTNTLFRAPIQATNPAQNYAICTANFLLNQPNLVFTAEPDGQIYYWQATNTSGPLKRQLFSSAYQGTSWHAMSRVKLAGQGDGLVGLNVNPTNPSSCNVIFWSPQFALPQPENIVETAPSAAVLPSANPLGSNAVVTVRLWDNEGNASTPLLQYQILGSTTWQNATLTTLDGSYNLGTRVAALPGGTNHIVTWNALADVGANVITNVLLRASAQDFMLTGSWSQPTPFQLNTTIAIVLNPTNPPVYFTGFRSIQGGIGLNWQSGSNVSLYLQRSPALAGTNLNWVNIWTGAPPTPVTGSYTDFFGTNPMEFYRMKTGSP
jgi:YD repeat-containing protein